MEIMADKEITEEILEKNGFKNDGTNVFSYIGNDCAVDVWYQPIAIRKRHWHCAIYIEDTKYLLCSTIIQTADQFNKLIDILDIDCGPLKC